MKDAVARYEAARARVKFWQDYLHGAKEWFDAHVLTTVPRHDRTGRLALWKRFLGAFAEEFKALKEAEEELAQAIKPLRVKPETERAAA